MPPETRSGSESSFPRELTDLPQWVAWQGRERGGKMTKVPIDPRSGKPARVDDPRTWGSFSEIARAAEPFDGVGFVFTSDDPYCGIDLDQAVDSGGKHEAWAREVLALFPADTYREISPSGRGLHLVVRATKPGSRSRTALGAGAIEIYDR